MPTTQRTHSTTSRPSSSKREVNGNGAGVPCPTDAEVFQAFAGGRPLVGDTTRCELLTSPGLLAGEPDEHLPRSLAVVLYSHGVPIGVNGLDRLGSIPFGATFDMDPRLECGRHIGCLRKHRLAAATVCVDVNVTAVQSATHDTFTSLLRCLS